MKGKIFTVAVTTLLAWQSPANAETVTEALQSRVELSGLVEVEAFYTDSDGENSSDINVATVELAIAATLSEWLSAETVLLWEDEGEGGDFNVDSATLSLGNEARSPFYFTVGLMAVPFGVFDTHLVSDPLTLELGETYETAGRLGYAADGLDASVYVFNGDTEETGETDNHIDNFGLHVGYARETENGRFAAGVAYLNDLAESDTLGEVVENTLSEHAAGYLVNFSAGRGPFSVIGEYLTAGDELKFAGNTAKPVAWNLEAGYAFELFNRETTVAVGYQGTEEAALFEQPEQRVLAGLSVSIVKNTALSFEVAADEAYGGGDSTTFTVQLASEF